MSKTVDPPELSPPTITPLSSDLSNPSIVVRRISETGWKDHADLDLTTNNWSTWHRRVIMVLQLSGGLDRYLEGKTSEPDPTLEPRTNENWAINDGAVRAFIKTRCSPTELSFIDDCSTALSTWTTLKARHQCQGTVSQIHLMQEAFVIRYSTSTPFADTSEKLRTLNDRIWAMGAPTADSFLVILMLLALSSPDFRGVRDAAVSGLASASASSPYTANHIRSRLDLEQQIINAETARSGLPGEVFTAKSDTNRTPAFCTNCKRPKHIAEYCVRAGGGLAGKTVKEAMAIQREKRLGSRPPRKPPSGTHASSTQGSNSKDTMASSKSGLPILRDSQNRAYILDSSSGQAFLLSTDTPTPTQEAHFSGLVTDDIVDLVAHSMTPADIEEYASTAWLDLQEELISSVDWASRTKSTDLASILIMPVEPTSRLQEVSTSTSPFLLDSGCTTHISPERHDFLSLRPISNRVVKGVNGSSINAIGIGSIKLNVSRGNRITLDNVLYIPSSTARLLSITCLVDSLPCSVLFDASGISLKSLSSSLITSGSHLPSRNLFQLNCT